MQSKGVGSGSRHPAGGVALQVAKLPALVALHHGEVIYERHDGLGIGRQVQISEKLLRVLQRTASHSATSIESLHDYTEKVQGRITQGVLPGVCAS